MGFGALNAGFLNCGFLLFRQWVSMKRRRREVCYKMVIRWMEVAWIFCGTWDGWVVGPAGWSAADESEDWSWHGVYDLIGDMAWSSCSAGYCT